MIGIGTSDWPAGDRRGSIPASWFVPETSGLGIDDGARAVYHRCRVRLGAWADDRLRLLHCRYQRIGSGYELFTHNPAGCVLYLLKRVDCAQAFPTLSYLSVGGRLSLTETFSLARTNEEQGG